MTLTAQRLREVLAYDPETGIFSRKVKAGHNRPCDRVGCVRDKSGSHPYLVVMVDYVLYRAHRLAWLYIHGEWPPQNIDHINGDTLDNRIANLRPCNQQQNNGNQRRAKNNTSGFRGVSFKADRGKWKAYIVVGNKQRHLGYFSSAEAASEAFKAEAVKVFGEFARLE